MSVPFSRRSMAAPGRSFASPGDQLGGESKWPRHYEATQFVAVSADRVFAYLDDHNRVAAHMSKSSWRMGGGSMRLQVDDRLGRGVGSHMKLSGRVFAILLAVEEVITIYEPPLRKAWETVGTPRLLVIAQYRLGFEIRPDRQGSAVRIFIDYALSEKGFSRWCGMLFGDYYARWCARQMLSDTMAHFAGPGN